MGPVTLHCHQSVTDFLPAQLYNCPDNENLIAIANKEIPNTDTCPTLWLNGQEINDEIKYFGTPIATDETLQYTTNQLTHLKVKQFHIEQKIKYLEWCNNNHICPDDFKVDITTTNLSDYSYKNTKHWSEVMERTIQHLTGIEINHNQEQLDHILFKIKDIFNFLHKISKPTIIDFIQGFSDNESKHIIKKHMKPQP